MISNSYKCIIYLCILYYVMAWNSKFSVTVRKNSKHISESKPKGSVRMQIDNENLFLGSRITNLYRGAAMAAACFIAPYSAHGDVSDLASSWSDSSIILSADETNPVALRDPLSSSSGTVTLPSGVKYSDAVMGEADGPVVEEGRTVQLLWVLRRSNGYFVDASSNYNNEPFIYKVGNTKKIIKGLDEGIRGMRPGGIRRIAVPAKLAYVEGVEEGMPGPLPRDFGPKRQIITRQDVQEVWNFEILVKKVK